MRKRTQKINWLTLLFLVPGWLVLAAGSCSKKNGSTDPVPTPVVSAEVTINASQTAQVIQGFGCATVFAPPNTAAYTAEEFDRLFGSGNGQVGLNLLRIRIASDDAWRATELNHAKWAIQRGARVFASPWSPPARMKTNGNIIGGSLLSDSAAAYAKYLNDFADYMSANGAPLYAVSVQNEPDWNPSYEGCQWTATEMTNFLKNHGHLVTSTRLMAPELVNNNQGYVNTILGDNGAVANLDILATHIYGGGVMENLNARNLNKEVWMTEHLDTLTHYGANIGTAEEIHNCLTKAHFSAYTWWYGKRFYGPLGQDGQVTKRGFMIAQFARFIKPGAVLLTSGTNTQADVLISAYKNPNGKIVVVAINKLGAEVKQKINITNATLSATVIPYSTTQNTNVVPGAGINTTGGGFEYKMPAYGVTTFVEQ